MREYRSRNAIYERMAGTPDRMVSAIAEEKGPAMLVCVNDFVGTGYSAAEGINSTLVPILEAKIPDWRKRVYVSYAAVVGYDSGVQYLRAQIPEEIEVHVANLLDESDRAFHEANGIFGSFEERERAREISQKFGSILEKNHPLGWEASEGLVVFYNTTPNNTLPILYKGGPLVGDKPWYAPFQR
jgi:hypothetical protein